MSKRIKLTTLSFALCLLLLFFAACEAVPNYTYSEQGFTVYEEQGERLYNAKGSKYEGENFTLYVDKDMPSEVADKCVYYTEQILVAVNTKRPIDVYLLCNYEFFYSNDAQLIVGEIDYKSLDYITAVIVTVFGQYTNYGLAYGYANEIAVSLGWQRNKAVNFKTPANSDLNDLTTLCFDTRFVSSDEAKLAQNNAIALVKWYLSNHSTAELEILIDSSSEVDSLSTFNVAFDEYYAENNARYIVQTVLFNYGGSGFDYTVKNAYTELYIRKNWVEYTDDLPAAFLHCDYSEVKQFFEINTLQMTQYREYFDFDEYLDTPPIVFENTVDGTSYYTGPKIIITTVGAFTHEYIHLLTHSRLKAKSLWDGEGATTYFAQLFNFYDMQMATMNYSKELPPEIYTQIRAFLGRDIDYSRDWKAMIHIYSVGMTDTNGYFNGASFVGYLVETYGKERTLNYIYDTGRTAEPIEKTHKELVADWIEYINTNYNIFGILQ
jgi:hypothetical protein